MQKPFKLLNYINMYTLKELKKVAYILDNITIPGSGNKLIYYRLFNDLATETKTIVFTEYQYNN